MGAYFPLQDDLRLDEQAGDMSDGRVVAGGESNHVTKALSCALCANSEEGEGMKCCGIAGLAAGATERSSNLESEFPNEKSANWRLAASPIYDFVCEQCFLSFRDPVRR
jgi:hypothetical protein